MSTAVAAPTQAAPPLPLFSPAQAAFTPSYTLYPYQEACVQATLKAFKGRSRGVLNVLATGLGKSIVISEVVRQCAGRGHGALVLVHRHELIQQLQRSLRMAGLKPLVEQAEHSARGSYIAMPSGVVVGSVGSMQGARLQSWDPASFRLIVVDETHHAVAESYQNILHHFGAGKYGTTRLVGFTATADRSDGKSLGTIFDTCAYNYQLPQAVRDGWLVRPKAFPLRTEPQVDLRKLDEGIRNGRDYTDDELDEVIQGNVGTIVNALRQYDPLKGRRTLGFAPRISSARAVCDGLRDVGFTADWVSGERYDRDDVIARHKAGEFQYLIGSMLMTEGYDDPPISGILNLRPTKSRSLYTQIVGRGVRRDPDNPDKIDCRVVDLAGITSRLSLAGPVDLFDDGTLSNAAIKDIEARAQELAVEQMEQREGEYDPMEVMEQAREEWEEYEMRREAARIKVKERRVNATMSEFDPLAAFDALGLKATPSAVSQQTERKATEAQLARLRKMKIQCDGNTTFDDAQAIIKADASRQRWGLATVPQLDLLLEFGMNPGQARRMKKAEASAWIDQKMQERKGGRN
jgi:superfamily II DNA or RNA helicase